MTSSDTTHPHRLSRSGVVRTLAAITAALTLSALIAPAAQAAGPESVAEWRFATAPSVVDASPAANVFTATGGADTAASLRPVTTDPLLSYTYDEAERSVRYQGWNDGVGIKGWVVALDTRGYADLTLTSQQRSSGSGPRDFAVQVSTDGQSTWQDVPGGAVTVGTDFASGGSVASLPLPASAADRADVAIRWVVTSTTSASGSTVGATGSSRIRDISVSGTSTGTPVERPTVATALSPLNGAVDAPLDAALTVTFNKPIALASGATASVIDDGGSPVAGVAATANGTQLSLTHAPLQPGRGYTVTVPRAAVAGAADGIAPASDIVWSFRTPAAPRDSVAEWAFTDDGDDGVFWATDGAYADHSALTSVGTRGEYGFHADRGNAISVQGWGGGAGTKYWLASLSSVGFENLALSSEHSASGSGPRDFVVQMSTDRVTWTDVPDSTIKTATHTFTCPDDTCRLTDVPLPAAASGASTLFLRWLQATDTPSNTDDNTTVGGYGDSFLRNIRITGDRIDGAPLVIPTVDVQTAPVDAAATVDLAAPVTLRVNKDVSIVDASSISIVDETGAAASGVVPTAKDDLVSIAHRDFGFGHRYTVTVPAASIAGADGVSPVRDIVWSFSTLAKTPTAFSMNFNGDTRTSMSFAWYTPPEVTATHVQIAPAGARDGEEFPDDGVIEFDGKSEIIDTFVTESDREARRTTKYASHKATADGLAPGTSYVYRVGDGTPNGWGGIGSFTTDSAIAEPFHFLFGSDSQASDLGSFLEWQDTFEKASAKVDDPKFLLVTGDLVDNGDLEEQWQWMLNSAADQFATVPYVPVLGGHEVEDSGTLPNNNFFNHFNEPRDAAGTGAHEGSVYSFEYGDALFMQFNSQYGGGLDENGDTAWVDPQFSKQLDWLRRTVAETDKRWKFVSLHKGVYSAGENVCNWEADRVAFYEKTLVPIFQETAVDVVLEAHDHMYMRSHQMRDGHPVDTITDENGQIVVQYDVTDPNGVLYLMPNALGNKFYETPEGCDTSFAAINAQPEKKMFVDFSVSRDTLSFTAYTAAKEDEIAGSDGLREFDHYSITRTDGTPDPVRDASVRIADGAASFSWKAPTASVEPVRGYRIYEKNDRVGVNWSAYIPAETGKEQYTFVQPISDDPTVRYEFVVRAVGAKDNSAPVAVAPPRVSDDEKAPSAPVGVTLRAASPFQVNVSWLPSVDDVAVAGYKVFRDGELVARTTTTTFQDAGREPGTTHEYRISAYDAAGNESAKSTPATVSTPRNPTTTDPQRPFGQHTVYAPGTLRPGVGQERMDATVASLYDAWKDAYLTQNPYESDQYYVYYNGNGEAGEDAPDAVTTSESNGYGMLITAIMAGHDPQAQTLFDALLRFAKAHPSSVDPDLMAWQQRDDGTAIVNTTEVDDEGEEYGDDAASDGDLDMAYALLMADAQWGSGGAFDYLSEARRLMAAILRSEVHPTDDVILLGDWTRDEIVFGRSTRTSDFMLQHFKDFAKATGNPRWTDVVDATQSASHDLFSRFSPTTGLLPDFAIRDGAGYRPVDPGFLEDDNDGAYNWNASRVPWRLGTDYLLTGDDRAQEQLSTMNSWLQTATHGDPSAIAQGYSLDGQPLDEWTDLAFSAPFTVSAMVEGGNQEWLDALWEANTAEPVTTYFGDSIRMLSLIVVSGNWWSPTGVGLPETAVAPVAPTGLTATATAPTSVRLEWQSTAGMLKTAATGRAEVIGYRVFRDGVAVASVAEGTSFVDSGLVGGTTYRYHVTAVDALGQESSPSDVAAVTTPKSGGGMPVDPGTPGSPHGGGLATTGGSVPIWLLLGGLALIAVGGIALIRRGRGGRSGRSTDVGGDA
ncbi:glycosyl hydrolase family 8 [Microbacterium sp. LWH10-1.2]|uniref:glycosyl hydrolase family 8 n=1 Tax=Microbacterium sp. LWH10-1.2 TaxID=3135255 RepID=UPI003139AE55